MRGLFKQTLSGCSGQYRQVSPAAARRGGSGAQRARATPVLGGRGSSARKRRNDGSKREAQGDSGAVPAPKRQKGVDGRKQQRTWEQSRALLEEYRDAHRGDCNVPQRWKDDPPLGKWVDMQKVQFRKYEADPATSRLSAERVVALREMGAIDSWRERSSRTFPHWKSGSRAHERELSHGQKHYTLFEV